jgi:hypothetical protein
MAKLRGAFIGSGPLWNLPLLLTSIGLAIGLYCVSHPGLLSH